MRFIDSHLHLGDFVGMEVLAYARGSETVLVTNGIDKASSLKGVNLAKDCPDLVRAFVGVHPSEAAKSPIGDWLSETLKQAEGIGEIGLDPKYSAIREDQEPIFRKQLETAEKQGKPVQIHSRGAEKECTEILDSYKLPAVLLHWFQGEK